MVIQKLGDMNRFTMAALHALLCHRRGELLNTEAEHRVHGITGESLRSR